MPKQTFFNLPDEKRERVLDCALDEFAEHGYKACSISRIVAAAGIAKGSFYQYFEDKDDLYLYIVETKIASRKLAVFEREKHRLDEMNLMNYLRLVFQSQLKEFGRDPRLTRISVDLVRNADTGIADLMWNKYKGSAGTFYLPIIRQEMEKGKIDPRVNSKMLNFMLLSMGQYITHLYQSGETEYLTREKIDRLVDDVEYILVHGIYPKEGV